MVNVHYIKFLYSNYSNNNALNVKLFDSKYPLPFIHSCLSVYLLACLYDCPCPCHLFKDVSILPC